MVEKNPKKAINKAGGERSRCKTSKEAQDEMSRFKPKCVSLIKLNVKTPDASVKQ